MKLKILLKAHCNIELLRVFIERLASKYPLNPFSSDFSSNITMCCLDSVRLYWRIDKSSSAEEVIQHAFNTEWITIPGKIPLPR